ncbi:unnamed protein product [Calypogeia fissa]
MDENKDAEKGNFKKNTEMANRSESAKKPKGIGTGAGNENGTVSSTEQSSKTDGMNEQDLSKNPEEDHNHDTNGVSKTKGRAASVRSRAVTKWGQKRKRNVANTYDDDQDYEETEESKPKSKRKRVKVAITQQIDRASSHGACLFPLADHLDNGYQKMISRRRLSLSKGKEVSITLTHCHQCKRNDKGGVINCQKCGTRRYCNMCITTWYPDWKREDFEKNCPRCRGNCNCKACLRINGQVSDDYKPSKSENVKHSRYLLRKVIPFLNDLHGDQSLELELERSLKGNPDYRPKQIFLHPDERLYCNECHTSIVDFHRHCENPECQYDLCLTCCKELRLGQQPGGAQAGSLGNQLEEKANGWKCNENGSIFCPAEVQGGCGSSLLRLRTLFEEEWVERLVQDVHGIVDRCSEPLSEVANTACEICTGEDHPSPSEDNNDTNHDGIDGNRRLAANRP